MSLRTVVLNERSRSDGLHVETPLGIINIRHKLVSSLEGGARVVSVEILPDRLAGKPEVKLDGYANNRLVEQSL